MKIVLIRHLKTEGNEKRQYIGSTDEPLSERAVREFLKKRCGEKRYAKEHGNEETIAAFPGVERVVASPMKRCVQTADLIYPGKSIVTEPLLRECDFGRFEQKTYEELKDEPDYIRWLESGGMTAFPGGEAQEEFRARCVRGMKKQIYRMMEEQAGSAAFIVHGGTIMAVLSALAEGKHSFYDWQVGNGEGYIMYAGEAEWREGIETVREVRRI